MFGTLLNFLKRKFWKPAKATHIVVVEPSDFRRGESYVLGPFSWLKAKKEARRAVRAHPYGQAMVWSRHGTVMLGKEELRPADPKEGPSTTPLLETQADFYQYRRQRREEQGPKSTVP